MARSHVINLVHCVFSTKGRAQLIRDPKNLWSCLRQIARNCDFDLLAVGGTSNHVHLLLSVPANQRLVDIVRDLKANSSRFMHEHCRGFAWQDGRRHQRQPIASSGRQKLHRPTGKASFRSWF